MKKIGILGTGVVARDLAAGFRKNGHEVMIGTRDPSKQVEWLKNGADGTGLGTFSEAAAFG